MSITKCIQVTLQMQSSILYSQLNESRLPTLHMTGLGLKKNPLQEPHKVFWGVLDRYQ